MLREVGDKGTAMGADLITCRKKIAEEKLCGGLIGEVIFVVAPVTLQVSADFVFIGVFSFHMDRQRGGLDIGQEAEVAEIGFSWRWLFICALSEFGLTKLREQSEQQ
jgi:hypothetical protein